MNQTTKEEIRIRLFHAAARGDLEALMCLVQSGVDIGARDYNGRTVLHLATERNHTHLVQYLVSKGADAESRDTGNLSPMDLAIANQRSFAVGTLAKDGRRSSRAVRRCASWLDDRQVDCEAIIRSSFPARVATAMIQGNAISNTRHESVSLFFSNIVDYAVLRSTMDPEALIDMLDRLFRRLDALAALHGVQTIDAVDGCFIAATNILSDQRTDHAVHLARFALSALAVAAATPLDPSRPALGGVQIRAGLHCGAVSACMLGAHGGLKYTLLGDAVNVASRMESHGSPGAAQCSTAAAALIAAQGGVVGAVLREREGGVDVKGLGRMSTFWLVHDTPPIPPPAPSVHPRARPVEAAEEADLAVPNNNCNSSSGPSAASPYSGPVHPRGTSLVLSRASCWARTPTLTKDPTSQCSHY